ncbi:hypothetical protein WJX73_002555 [Symbiochloris irregularis]|uniref:Uncharacterized protein n=1 Tax=Symbiochloris irregularis TaxID=706552 RepID=A0AAW1P596_9CHLO
MEFSSMSRTCQHSAAEAMPRPDSAVVATLTQGALAICDWAPTPCSHALATPCQRLREALSQSDKHATRKQTSTGPGVIDKPHDRGGKPATATLSVKQAGHAAASVSCKAVVRHAVRSPRSVEATVAVVFALYPAGFICPCQEEAMRIGKSSRQIIFGQLLPTHAVLSSRLQGGCRRLTQGALKFSPLGFGLQNCHSDSSGGSCHGVTGFHYCVIDNHLAWPVGLGVFEGWSCKAAWRPWLLCKIPARRSRITDGLHQALLSATCSLQEGFK